MRCRCYIGSAEISRNIRTKRRTPTPVSTTFAGENTYFIYQNADLGHSLLLEAYQANTLSKSVTEGIKDVYSRIKPLDPSIIATSGLIWPLNLLLKDVENGAGRIADLELGGEWMGKQVLLRALFILIQRIADDELEVR